MILDTNVLLDLLDGSPKVDAALSELRAENELFVNEIVFAEIASRYPDRESVEIDLADLGLPIVR